MRKLVAILYNTDDNERHYKDVDAIDTAIRDLGYSVTRIEVDKDIEKVIQHITDVSPKYIFNLCEAVGENSQGEIYIAGVLELLGIPYTGNRPSSLSISLDKAKAKDILYSHGISTPRYQVFDSNSAALMDDMRFPLIIKPLGEDGSLGIDKDSVVYDKEVFYERLKRKKEELNKPLIVEEYIEGRELNISVLGNNNVRVLPISEIDYSAVPCGIPRICSYSAKWDEDSPEYKNTVPVCPADIHPGLRKKMSDLAVQVYKIIGCTDYGRIDIRLDKKEIPYVIDVNPNPCLSPDSGFVRSAAASGLSYRDLIREILINCHKRYYNGGVSCHDDNHTKSTASGFLEQDKIRVRELQPKDREAITGIVERARQFTEEEKKCALELLDIYLANETKDYEFLVVVNTEDTPYGYVSFGEIPLTKGCYDIYWIVCDSVFCGNGIGTKLLDSLEEGLQKRGARKLFAETSSQESYRQARNFYRSKGFRQASRIPDFYKLGDDKLIYVKTLNVTI